MFTMTGLQLRAAIARQAVEASRDWGCGDGSGRREPKGPRRYLRRRHGRHAPSLRCRAKGFAPHPRNRARPPKCTRRPLPCETGRRHCATGADVPRRRACPGCAQGLFPGAPGAVPMPSFTGGFPGGCGSKPLPTPLLPLGPPVDRAIAGELSDVDSRTAIAGGTVRAKRPLAFRKSRLSPSGLDILILPLSSRFTKRAAPHCATK